MNSVHFSKVRRSTRLSLSLYRSWAYSSHRYARKQGYFAWPLAYDPGSSLFLKSPCISIFILLFSFLVLPASFPSSFDRTGIYVALWSCCRECYSFLEQSKVCFLSALSLNVLLSSFVDPMFPQFSRSSDTRGSSLLPSYPLPYGLS